MAQIEGIQVNFCTITTPHRHLNNLISNVYMCVALHRWCKSDLVETSTMMKRKRMDELTKTPF